MRHARRPGTYDIEAGELLDADADVVDWVILAKGRFEIMKAMRVAFA